MPTLKQVRAAFGTTIAANLGGFTVYHRVAANMLVPCLVVMPTAADYLVTFNRGGDMWDFNLHILVPSADDDVGQDLLDEYVAGTGPRSIVAIIHANKSLGLAGTDAHISGMTGYSFRFEAVGTPHIGATLRAQVLVTN